MSFETVQSKAFDQYWMNQFKEGESLDDLTDRLQKLFEQKGGHSDFNIDSDTKSWFETTIAQAIAAKKSYYSNTVTGQISSFFQRIAKTFFGCREYMTPLERAEAFAQTVSQSNPIVHLNPEVDEELNSAAPGEFKLTQTSLLDARLFFELHKEQMLDLSRSENKALCLKVPGEDNSSFYVFPNGNCYLVSKEKANRVSVGATKEIYRAYDLVNNKTVACMSSREIPNEDPTVNFSLVKNEYKMLSHFKDVNGVLQVRNGFVQNGSAIFFSDYYAEGNLSSFMKKSGDSLTPKQKMHFLIKLLERMEQIHNMGYLHRDMKDPNVLIQQVVKDGEVLFEPIIIDFDRCCSSKDHSFLKGIASTPDYWPPEYAKIIMEDEAVQEGATSTDKLAHVTTDKMDIWALGLVLYHIHYRKQAPWEDMGLQQKMRTVSNLEDNWFLPDAHDEIGQVIYQMLQVDPSKRISLAEAISQLQQGSPEANSWSEFLQ